MAAYMSALGADNIRCLLGHNVRHLTLKTFAHLCAGKRTDRQTDRQLELDRKTQRDTEWTTKDAICVIASGSRTDWSMAGRCYSNR